MNTIPKRTYASVVKPIQVVSNEISRKIQENKALKDEEIRRFNEEHDRRAGDYIEKIQRENAEKLERAQVQAHLRRGKVEGPFTNPHDWDKRMAYIKYVLDAKW